MNHEHAILAGGCFWGMEDLIRNLPGVVDTTVGYTGGTTLNPTYDIIKSSVTGHAEAIEVVFDPSKLSYRALLEFFIRVWIAALACVAYQNPPPPRGGQWWQGCPYVCT